LPALILPHVSVTSRYRPRCHTDRSTMLTFQFTFAPLIWQELADLKSFFSEVIPAAAPPPIPADLSALSAKELKELLKSRGVDFSDCYEKSDLVAKCAELKK